MPTQKLTPEIITAAIEGYESQKAAIDDRIAELRAMLSGKPARTTGPAGTAGRQRQNMSAAGRARIAAAQRKRWAALKRHSESPETNSPKRKVSPARKAALIANLAKARAARAAKRAEAARKA